MGPRWGYLLSEVGMGLRRNLLMTVATVVTVTVSLALLGAALLVQRQVDDTERLFYAQVEVSVFLLDDSTASQRATLEEDLIASPVVETVEYESKQEAYEQYRELFADDPDLVDSVTPDMLPASFRVKLDDPERFDVIASQFTNYPGVETIADQRNVLDRFFQVMSAIRNGALAVALLQLVAAVALISNTIRITAFARREQTGIMKLVGATNWYIRLPFVLEGIVAGLIGAVTAAGLLFLAEATLIERLRGAVQFVPFVGTADIVAVLPVLLALGVGIATVASFVSLRRFLAV